MLKLIFRLLMPVASRSLASMAAMISLVWSERDRMERLMTKIVYGNANPRDITALGAAMQKYLVDRSDREELMASIQS